MGHFRFHRTVGALGDAKELEYVIALHQTCMPGTRENATVSSLDIARFLKSRYRLTLTHAQAIQIVRDLGGGDVSVQEKKQRKKKKRSHKRNGKNVHSSAIASIPEEGEEEDTFEDALELSPDATPSHHGWYQRYFGGHKSDHAETTTELVDQSNYFSTTEENGHRGSSKVLSRFHFRRHTQASDASPAAVSTESRFKGLLGGRKSAETATKKQQQDLAIPIAADEDVSSLDQFEDSVADESQLRMDHGKNADVSAPAEVPSTEKRHGLRFRGLFGGRKSDTSSDKASPTSNDEGGSSLEQFQDSVVDESQFGMSGSAAVLSSAAGMSSSTTVQPQAGTDPNASIVDAKDRPEEYLDLVQTLSTLLIPAFARAGHEYWNGPVERYAPPRPQSRYRILMPFHRAAHFFRKWWSGITPVPDHPEGHMLGDFYEILLADFAGTNDFILNEAFVESLLIQHGEFERARNTTLIREMVEAARSQSGRFDLEAMANAISSDLAEWQVGSEDHASSFFSDVFGVDNPGLVADLEAKEDGVPHNVDVEANEAVEDNNDKDDSSQEDSEEHCVPHCCCCCCRLVSACCRCYCALMCPANKGPFKTQRYNIDMVVDSFFSGWTYVASWLFFVMSVVLYATMFLAAAQLDFDDCHSDSEFWCQIGITVWNWTIIGLSLSFFGIVMLVPLTHGNNPFRRSVFNQFVSVTIAVIYAVVPWAVANYYKENLDENADSEFAQTANDPYWDLFTDFTFSVGLVVAAIYVLQAVIIKVQVQLEKCTRRFFLLLKYFFATSNLRAESRLKWAAVRKLNTLLVNGCEMHLLDPEVDWTSRLRRASSSDSAPSYVSTDQTMRNFLLRGSQQELVGGFLWTWGRLLNGSYFYKEGLWINSRLIIFQVLQLVVGTLLAVVALLSVENIAKAADEARADLSPLYPQWIFDLYPTSEMIYISLYPASIVAISVEGLLILLYIPSATATVLAYRSQVSPSLGSEYFNKFRASVDTAYMNSGNALYGMIGSAGLFYIIVGGILYLFQWPPTQDFMIRILVWGIGISITCGMKYVLTLSCRTIQYRSFFRVRPGAAALSSLALECWFIGLGGGVLLGRITQFLLAAAFWVGRIDVPFLNENVSILGYSFDYVPSYFVKDLLVHEAHRHPYMERLAQMYLMKLRHKKFASKAGAAWRQLLVISLLPWLKKRRVFNEERRREALAALEARRRGDEDIPKRPVNVFEQAALEAVATGGEKVQGAVGEVGTGLHDLAQGASKDDEDSFSECLEFDDDTDHSGIGSEK